MEALPRLPASIPRASRGSRESVLKQGVQRRRPAVRTVRRGDRHRGRPACAPVQRRCVKAGRTRGARNRNPGPRRDERSDAWHFVPSPKFVRCLQRPDVEAARRRSKPRAGGGRPGTRRGAASRGVEAAPAARRCHPGAAQAAARSPDTTSTCTVRRAAEEPERPINRATGELPPRSMERPRARRRGHSSGRELVGSSVNRAAESSEARSLKRPRAYDTHEHRNEGARTERPAAARGSTTARKGGDSPSRPPAATRRHPEAFPGPRTSGSARHVMRTRVFARKITRTCGVGTVTAGTGRAGGTRGFVSPRESRSTRA